MKKIILLFVFLLEGCFLYQETPKYLVQNEVVYSPEKGKKFFVDSSTKSVEDTKLKIYFKDYLKNLGYKIVDDKSKAQYVLVFKTVEESYQTKTTVPVFGKTNVRSANSFSYGTSNTNLYGTANRFGNTTTFSGNANSIYSQNTHTTYNYDYGVTGYKEVVHNEHLKYLKIDVTDSKTKDVVAQSGFGTSLNISDDLFISYIQNTYDNLSIFTPLEPHFYDCKNGVCTVIGPARKK